ncbi:MAG: helix-turn-helix transcriptional regulator [Alphaproteobacteria bacterium]|nr:helix-turn-helix transcriptional regulator [Alphaproteobacteria bacterium]
MNSSTGNAPKSRRDLAYYRQRFRNRVFSRLVSFVAEQAQEQKVTKKEVAEKIRKDPAQLSRLLGSPSNLTLDTISDLLLAFDAEAEPFAIVLFKDRRPSNQLHPLAASVLDMAPPSAEGKTQSAGAGEKIIKPIGHGPEISFVAGPV